MCEGFGEFQTLPILKLKILKYKAARNSFDIGLGLGTRTRSAGAFRGLGG